MISQPQIIKEIKLTKFSFHLHFPCFIYSFSQQVCKKKQLTSLLVTFLYLSFSYCFCFYIKVPFFRQIRDGCLFCKNGFLWKWCLDHGFLRKACSWCVSVLIFSLLFVSSVTKILL